MFEAGDVVRLSERGRRLRQGEVIEAVGMVAGVSGTVARVQWAHRPQGETWGEEVDNLERVAV